MQSPRTIAAAVVSSLSLLFVTSLVAETTPQDAPAFKRGWHQSFSQAQAEAQSSGKPLLIHFYTDWCGPCQQMERGVLNQRDVVNCLGVDVVGVKVNADHHPEIKSRFGVSGFPTDVLVSPEGKVVNRYVGMTSQSSYVARLERAGAKYQTTPQTQLASQSKNQSPGKTGAVEVTTFKPALAEKKLLGLDGYSPVALASGKIWKKGNPEIEAEHQGITYCFANEEEQQQFLSDPAAYAPRLLGCDPVMLAESGRAVRGQTKHGVFYRDRVFLMANEANQNEFLRNPAFYANQSFAVDVDEIEQLVSR